MPADARIVLVGSRVAGGASGRSQNAANKAALLGLSRCWAVLDRTIGCIVIAGRPAAMLVTAVTLAAWQEKGATLLYTQPNHYAQVSAEQFEQACAALTRHDQ